MPPLCRAANNQNINVVKLILANPGVQINATDHLGRTALSLATGHGNREIASLLRAAGAR